MLMEPNDTDLKPTPYDDPVIRRRFVEFLGGGDSLADSTAVYVTGADGCHMRPDSLTAIGDLFDSLGGEDDIARSLLDSHSVIAHLDIEYVNFDSPAECYLDPLRTFGLQQPVIDTIEEQLLEFGIRPLHLITGQGHHFVWRMERDSEVVARLIDLIPEGLRSSHTTHNPCSGEIEGMGVHAFAGLGLVMEFLALQVKARAAPHSEIPVAITAVHVGGKPGGMREIVSIDISEYGDPLWTRAVRMPFTRYQKPWKNGLARALGIEDRIPPLFTIPLHEMDFRIAIDLRQSEEQMRGLARRACVRIPEQSAGTGKLIDAYLQSPARRFHESYYGVKIDEPSAVGRWFKQLPPCARHVVGHPNDLLLKPAGMQLVARCLLALGVAPRRISAMIAAIFSDRSHGWEQQWDVYSPELRADFYTRLFCCQLAVGVDSAIDFNCVSTQEKGFCFDAHECSLSPFREKLLAREGGVEA